MKNLGDILKNKILSKQVVSKRKVNVRWEQATEFGSYVNIPTVVVLKLCKKYGDSRVFGLRSWLKDLSTDMKYKDKIGLAVWRLEDKKKGAIPNKQDVARQHAVSATNV